MLILFADKTPRSTHSDRSDSTTMTSSAWVYTNIYANNSLISYSGHWNLSTYVPLSDGATASIRYLGQFTAAP